MIIIHNCYLILIAIIRPNNDSYPGFDPKNQYIGAVTPLDSVATSKANAMLSNWEGVISSKNEVASGEFDEDNVEIQIPQ